MNKKRVREVYDKDYYSFKVLLQLPLVKSTLTQLKIHLKKLGCDIPETGFKTLKDYRSWLSKYKNSIFEARLKGHEKYFSIDNELKKILLMYNLNEKIFNFYLRHYFFFGKEMFYKPLFEVSYKPGKEFVEPELWIKIFSYTKSEDFINNWDIIANYQKQLLKYHPRSKPKTSFEDHLKIYLVYLSIKMLSREERQKLYNFGDIYEATCMTVKSKHQTYISYDDLKKIITEFNKSFPFFREK